MYIYEEIFEEPSEPMTTITREGFITLKRTIGENSPKYVRVIYDDLTKNNLSENLDIRLYKLTLRHYKAYSYCGTVAKNYLIYKNIQYTKNQQRNLPYDEMLDDFTNNPKYSIPGEIKKHGLVEKLIKEMSSEIKQMMAEREKNALTDDEMKVGVALTELLDNWEEVLNVDGSNKLQKSSVLYFLREETMMSTKEVRENMKSFKRAYYLLKKNLIEND